MPTVTIGSHRPIENECSRSQSHLAAAGGIGPARSPVGRVGVVAVDSRETVSVTPIPATPKRLAACHVPRRTASQITTATHVNPGICTYDDLLIDREIELVGCRRGIRCVGQDSAIDEVD